MFQHLQGGDRVNIQHLFQHLQVIGVNIQHQQLRRFRQHFARWLREHEMAEARWSVAMSVHERKVEIAKENMAKIVRMQEPIHPPLVVDWEAVLQATREQRKLNEVASRAERVQEDLGLESRVATDNFIALLANVERCKAALAERAEADASG